MEVFLVVRRTTWRKGLALLLVVAAVVVFQALTRVKESSQEADGRLVFTNQFMPVPEDREREIGTTPVQEDAVLPAMAPVASQSNPAFDDFRATRLQGRARRIETVEGILESDGLNDESRASLHTELLSLAGDAELEERVEGLLVARGLYDAVVMINKSNADVLVSQRITREQAGQIGSVVARVAGLPLNQITIVDGASPDDSSLE